MSDNSRRHVFISHHHVDDAEVDKLTSLLKGKGLDIRNSSIRAKPANRERLDKGLVRREVIRRLLRMKISWAGTVIVLIGKETYSRDWVKWEIEEAKKQGKRIVGIHARGQTQAEAPPGLADYATTIVHWDSESIIAAIEGTNENAFENPDGSPSTPMHVQVTSVC